MTNKISIRICVGTTCYVKGNREIKKAMENLPEEIKSRVEVKGAIDIDGCETGKAMEHPYVEINGKVLANATVEKVLAAINHELKVIA
ncbi:MAG: NAD(P)H-dependent oxidoreductase subunit E [Bacteroidales bacterium]